MITIFICKDLATAKEIASKYLQPGTMPYVNNLECTYEEAVAKVEELERQ